MKKYRDQLAAHLDPYRRDIETFPDLSMALRASGYYYRQLYAVTANDARERYPADLTTYYDAFLAQTREIARAGLNGTREIRERVL